MIRSSLDVCLLSSRLCLACVCCMCCSPLAACFALWWPGHRLLVSSCLVCVVAVRWLFLALAAPRSCLELSESVWLGSRFRGDRCNVLTHVRDVNKVMFVLCSGALLFSMVTRTISFFSWNMQGLGNRLGVMMSCVSSSLSAPRWLLYKKQSSQSLTRRKQNPSFPARLIHFEAKEAIGASRGILTAWDDSVCTLHSVSNHPYTLTTNFSLTRDGTAFMVTNVYTPTTHVDKACFLTELKEILEPWVVLGHFNLLRDPSDKNNESFNSLEADMFNDVVNALEWIEIP